MRNGYILCLLRLIALNFTFSFKQSSNTCVHSAAVQGLFGEAGIWPFGS